MYVNLKAPISYLGLVRTQDFFWKKHRDHVSYKIMCYQIEERNDVHIYTRFSKLHELREKLKAGKIEDLVLPPLTRGFKHFTNMKTRWTEINAFLKTLNKNMHKQKVYETVNQVLNIPIPDITLGSSKSTFNFEKLDVTPNRNLVAVEFQSSENERENTIMLITTNTFEDLLRVSSEKTIS